MAMGLLNSRKLDLLKFINSLDLKINNLELLNIALTHSSYIKESFRGKLEDNQRLEFFGDAVLKLFISEYLMKKYPKYTEGELSNLRAFVVSEKVLSKIAKNISLQKYMLLGKNEKKAPPESIASDALEALLAVIYYDCGHNSAKDFILNNWIEYIELADKSKEKENFKAVLQEYSQANKLGLPVYKTISEIGPDHNKEFEVCVFLNENELARGWGKTKKEASQEAAKNTLVILEKKNKYKISIKNEK